MKIIAGSEPTSGDTGEVSYRIIEEVVATTSPGELVACLEKWMPLKFETLVHLLDWKDVFNKLDERLTNIMHTRRNELVLTDKESVISEGTPKGDLETDIRELKTILKFTAQVLENSIFKDVYNSAEILVELLNAYDDELMALALQALVALAVAPQSHRCNLDMPESYSTALHQNQAYFDAIFELIDASYFVTDIPIQEFLSEDFIITPEMRKVKVDLNTRSKYSKSLLAPDTRGEVVEVERFLLPENNFEIADISEEPASLQEILSVQAASLTSGLKLSLLCAVRMRRLLLTPVGRQQLMRIQYQATSVLVGCYPEISVLYTFFQDKIELIKNFIHLLRTGPGSLDYQHNLLDLDIRVVACQSLEAIVGSHDHASYAAPIVVRYPWMLYDMGLNKGQYMGTLPCLIRSAMSYLLSLEAAGVSTDASDTMDVVSHSNTNVTITTCADDMESRLLWVENIFILLSAVVNEVESAVSALNDNGLVGSILQMVGREHYTVRNKHFKYVECLVVEILEMTVTHYSPALVSFKEKNGLESVINRLYREITMCLGDITIDTTASAMDSASSANGTLYQDHASHISIIPVECSILIQRLFTLIRSVQSIGGTDVNNTQWYKLPALTNSLRLIFANAAKVGHLILAPALSLLADIVGNDPAPPSILSYMITSGLAKEALVAVTTAATTNTNTSSTTTITTATTIHSPAINSTTVVYSEELMKALLDLISALSLTADGIALVNEISPFHTIFAVFYNPEYVYPRSRVIMNSLPNLVGAGIEELLRHYPAYATNVISELTACLAHITSLAEVYVGEDNFSTQCGNVRFDAQYQNIVQFCTAFTLCLEPILLKKETVTALHERNALALLMKVLRIALGPPRYVLDSFACMVDSTAGSIGYTPLIAMVVHRCFHQIAEIEAVKLCEVLMTELNLASVALERDLQSHVARYVPLTDSIVPVTIGGNANPLLAGLLDTVTRAPLQDYCDNHQLDDRLLSFARIVRGFALLDVLVESLGLVLANRTDERILAQCMAVLSTADNWGVIESLVNKYSVPTHLEMARARGLYVNSTKENCVKVHPVYHLTVIAAEYINVKEGLESNVTVCRLGRGTTIEAYERQTSGLGSVLKYRTKLGWVSVYKTFASNDPQILVTAITQKSAEECTEEIARNVSVYEDPEKRSDFEKFANVSAKRGGFLALYHFNHTIKTHLLSVIGRHTFSKSAGAGLVHENYSLTEHSAPRVNVLMSCLKSLIPAVVNSTPRSAFDMSALLDSTTSAATSTTATATGNKNEAIEQSEPKVTRPKPLRARKDGPDPEPRGRKNAPVSDTVRVDNNSLLFTATTNTVLKEQFFQHDTVPDMATFPTSVVYLSLRLIELSQALFFDIRRNKMELNPLFLAHTVYDNNTLESILHVALKVFLCALPDIEIETVDNPEHHGMYVGEWYPLKESELDFDRPEDLTADTKTDTVSTSSAAVEEKGSAMDVEPSVTPAAATPAAGSAKANTKGNKGKKGKKNAPPVDATPAASSSHTETAEPFKPFASYLAYRRALRERRLFAVSSIDNIIEWWKRLCSSLLPTVSSLERGLQRQVDKKHDLDIYGMKRYTVNLVSKYLSQVWSHPQLHLLPPTTTKNVLDLMAVVVKTMHDLKSVQSLRTPAPAATSAGSSALSTLDASARRALGSARRINLGAHGSNAALHAHLRALSNMNGGNAGAAPDFAVSEDTIRNVEEMGFARRAITRAATLLHTNDVNSLVAYLLENPYVDEPDPPAPVAAAPAPAVAAAAEPAASASASGEGAAVDGATNNSTSAPAAGSSAAASAPAPAVPAGTGNPLTDAAAADDILASMFGMGMHQDLFSHAFPSVSRSRSNSTFPDATEPGKFSAALPLVVTQSEADLKAEKDLLQRILKCIYGDVPSLCMRLIEKGPSKHLALLDAETRTRNAGITTEVNTVMVLNQMVRCLEKNPLPESLLKIVQLSWLYRRAITIFKEGELNEEKFSGLFGLLHAIVVLLTCKVQSPSMGRAPAATNELHFLIFTLDDRYNELYPLMVATLESFTSELGGSTDGLSAAEASRVEWIGPAVLILDLVSQPVLVEPESLRTYRAELESYGKPAGADSSSNSSLSADDSLLSEQVKSALDRLFLRKNTASSASLDELFSFPPRLFGMKNRGAHSPMDIILPRSGGSASKLSDKGAATSKDTGSSSADASKTSSEALPLFEEAVSVDLKLRALKVGLSLLRLTANGKSANVNVPQAAMQLVAHLTRHPDARKEFHAQQGGVLVLRHRSSFAGMNSVVFTLLQQVLEDEKFLTQSMVTAIRLCLLRLSKQSSPHVLFKNFMEVISPVVFREQALFMKVLKSHTHIKCMSGQNFISLRETPLVEDKTTSTSAAGAAVTETALVPVDPATSAAPAVSAPAEVPTTSAKKQRLADGSAATTAVHSAVKLTATTPGASQSSAASGIKSGAKRVLHAGHHEGATQVPPPSASKATPHGASTVTSHNETVNEIVDELFTRIICKYLSIKTMDAEGNTKLTTDFVAADTSLTIAQMLIIAADLIASLPSFAISVHRYVFNLSKVPSWAAQVASAELPVKHALTGQTLGGLFVTFVVHALLLPARVSYPAAADATTDTLPAAEAKTKKATRIAAVEKLAGAPAALRDACSYFLASLASRPGEGRRRVLNEVLNTANIGSLVINTTEQFRALVAFSETILYLLNPPRKWASRDAFILPAKDILTSLAKQNAHTRLSAAVCALDLSHPLALETSIVLAVPLDIIIRKGLEPAPLAATLLAGADASAVKPAAGATAVALRVLPTSARPTRASATGVASTEVAAPVAVAAGASATPAVRRATFAASVTDPAAAASQAANTGSANITTGVPLTAQSFVTPASNRRRGNTDQSLDAEERMLLLTNTEMHNASDQHDHLVRPAGAFDSDVDGSDDDFDEEEGAEDGHEVAEALGAGEAFHHMHDEEEDDDEDDENEDGDDSGEEGSEDDEGHGHSHGHGHHHIRHHAHHHSHGSHSSDDDSDGNDSGSDVTGERDDDEDDDDEDGDDDDDDDDEDHHHHLDESGEFVEDDDDDEDMDEMDSIGDEEGSDGEGSEEPDLEVAIELDSDSGSDVEGDGNEGEEEEGEEDAEGGEGNSQEGSHDGSEGSEEMGMDDESEIEDDDVELDDEEDVEHMMDVNALVRRPRGRHWRHASHASNAALSQEEGEGEDQGEGDDDEDSHDEEADEEEEENEEEEQDGIEGDFEGEHDGSYFAGEDGYISNGDAREEEEGDEENQNNDDFWLEMNGAEEGGSASSAAPSARRMSHGGMSANAARSHVREFFTRARHNERSRARSSMGGGGMGGGNAGNHTVTDITNMLREAAAAGGANVVSMGPLFSGGGAAGNGQDGSTALLNRPFWMRGGERGEGNMEDRLGQISNSFTDFLGNLLPPNMTLSSSTARVDPRTGAVTLSFGGTQNEAGEAPAGRPVSAMSALAAQTSGHQAAARPPTHPLLAVTDATRNRFLQPCPNSLTLGGNARALVRAFPGLANQTTSGSTIDSSMRAGPVSERRNSVGPIVSDRRWGTDLGDLEPAGARLAALTTAVETALGDAIEREKPVETKSRSNSTSGASARVRPFGGLSGRSRSAGHDGGDGGDSYESDDQGDEDQDDNSTGGFADAFRAAAVARIRRQMGLGREPAESKEEEGELQESKETEPEPSRSAASSSSSAAGSSQPAPTPSTEASQSSSGAITAADLTAALSAHSAAAAAANTAMDVETPAPVPDTASSSAAAASSAAAPVSTELAIEEPAEVNAENLAFIESLSDDVRDEVLMSVDEDFIRSLPARIQREARAVRQPLEDSLAVTASSSHQPTAVVATAPPAASTSSAGAVPSFSIDFSAIMDDLRTINDSNTAAAATTSASATVAASAVAPAPAVESAPVAASANEVLRRLLAAASGSTASNAASSNEGSNATNAGSETSVTSSAATNAAPTSSSTVVPAGPATPAPAAPTAEETRAAELQLTVSLAEDRTDSVLPFGAHLIARLLRSLFTTNKSKLPRSVLKLLSTACRYKQSRVWIIRALFGSLSHAGARVVDCVRKVPLESDFAATTAGVAAFEAEMTRLQTAVDLTSTSALNFRRILCGISFLFRKTDKLVWYDIMMRPLLEEDSVWLFGSLISLLSNPVNASSINLEYLLQVMEELVGAYSKMSAKQANELAAAAQARIDANRRSAGGAPTRRSVSYAHTPAASLDTIFECVDENSSSHKRRRLDDVETPTAESNSAAMNMSPPRRGRAASIDIESAAADVALSAASSGPSGAAASSTALVPANPSQDEAVKPVLQDARHRMPFPVLVESEAKILCALAGSSECGGPARKRLMRVMRNLSLCDTNWMLFLDNLAVVGADLAARATMEFSNLHNTLVEVVQNNESAATAMARPELSAPKSLSEVRLLNVLRIMSALRTRTGAAAPAEAEVVASRMRRIQANGLWESLCDCLDIVRDLEGITDVAADEVEDKSHHKNSSSSSSGNNQAAKPEEDKKVTLSSLTMRFMPLIECYLSVCATTMLVRPDNVSGSAMNESQKELERMSSGFKRRHSRDDSHLPVAVTSGTSSNNASSMRQSPSIASTPMQGGPHADLASPFNLNRVNSMLPGSRFRQHPAYFQMQMELNDEAAAERLVNFTSQNRVLFNNVLRNNVQLLESSFSPLVSVPKCRQLLHFDIKRAFFKMKLKRMRQSAARMHGALRLNVRRSRVFEESFQALRYKTADEMRRRLSVNFHGEEGMDAGGLTREWYGVLAREIFNPNYALFTSAGDNVTFQPNSQSHINPDHNSYFKFVGRVIGKAICDGHLLDAHFTRSFYKHILGMPVSVVDLEAIDPEYFKSLKQILATPLDLLGLDLTFSAEQNDFGKIKIIDLIPQGQDVAVTDDTKHEYVKLLAHHRMTTAIRSQIDSFLEGFHELVPPELISIFDAQELELLISGLPDIDLDDLRAHTEYHSYKSTDPEIGYFWNVLKSFSKQEKALFLQFVTGTSKVPLDGFAALQGSDGIKQFNIHKAFGGSHLLPSAHTCFNQLDLPEYSTEEMLREKLLIAIREGSEGFGFA